MEKTFKFKTSIKCGGCIAKVAPFLNSADSDCRWDVDTANPDRILTVHTQSLSESDIVERVQEAGFVIEPLVG
ncbi:MAG: hypothetical protein QM786_18800 [Breznakibacter sp.]